MAATTPLFVFDLGCVQPYFIDTIVASNEEISLPLVNIIFFPIKTSRRRWFLLSVVTEFELIFFQLTIPFIACRMVCSHTARTNLAGKGLGIVVYY